MVYVHPYPSDTALVFYSLEDEMVQRIEPNSRNSSADGGIETKQNRKVKRNRRNGMNECCKLNLYDTINFNLFVRIVIELIKSEFIRLSLV